MMRYLALGLLAVAVLSGVIIGCGPRSELAKDKIIKKLDSYLGDLDVKRKKIEVKQRELVKQLATVREKRIEADVRLDVLQEKKKSGEEKISVLTGKLTKVRDLVKEAQEANGTIERDGKSYTAEDIKKSADRVTAAFKSEQTRMSGIDASITALEGARDALTSQENSAKGLMEKLLVKIDEIDSKKIAVDAVRDATSISGDNKSINDSLAALEKEIEGLSIDVETALRVEQEKMNDLNSTYNDVDKLLSESPSLDSIGAEIDELLGDKK